MMFTKLKLSWWERHRDRRARLKARKEAEQEYQALVDEARSNWHVVKKTIVECVDTSHGARSGAGEALLVGEENQLGERRFRIVTDPWPGTEYPGKAKILLWVLEAEPRSLPCQKWN